jgi:hypothetical protein
LPFGGERAIVLRTCADHGPVTIGGDHTMLVRVTSDLLQFLRDSGIIDDKDARALMPDCATLPDGIIRHNYTRARAGWTGDLVAMGIHYQVGRLNRDEAKAARIYKLAADRGHPQAQWLGADLYRQGIGVARDPAAARALAITSAAAGEAPAMNILGVLARDRVGQATNDERAAQLPRRHLYRARKRCL